MKKELCASCSGILTHKNVDYEKKVGQQRMLFEGVPARACSSCEEIWIDGATLEKIEQIFIKGKKSTRQITLPVWSFPKSACPT